MLKWIVKGEPYVPGDETTTTVVVAGMTLIL
jgi:hypothetical protein